MKTLTGSAMLFFLGLLSLHFSKSCAASTSPELDLDQMAAEIAEQIRVVAANPQDYRSLPLDVAQQELRRGFLETDRALKAMMKIPGLQWQTYSQEQVEEKLMKLGFLGGLGLMGTLFVGANFEHTAFYAQHLHFFEKTFFKVVLGTSGAVLFGTSSGIIAEASQPVARFFGAAIAFPKNAWRALGYAFARTLTPKERILKRHFKRRLVAELRKRGFSATLSDKGACTVYLTNKPIISIADLDDVNFIAAQSRVARTK